MFSTCERNVSFPWLLSRCPSFRRGPISKRSPSIQPSHFSWSVPRRSCPASNSQQPMLARSRISALLSMAYHSPSNWPPLASKLCPPRYFWLVSPNVLLCSPAVRAACQSASRPCARRCNGAMNYSHRMSNGSSACSPFLSAVVLSRQ